MPNKRADIIQACSLLEKKVNNPKLKIIILVIL